MPMGFSPSPPGTEYLGYSDGKQVKYVCEQADIWRGPMPYYGEPQLLDAGQTKIADQIRAVDFRLYPEFASFRLLVFGLWSSSASYAALRVSIDNGATFPSGAGGYNWIESYTSGTGAAPFRQSGTGDTMRCIVIGGLSGGSSSVIKELVADVPRGINGNYANILYSAMAFKVKIDGMGYFGATVPLTHVRLCCQPQTYVATDIVFQCKYQWWGY